jgi:16S rRNA (guanine527-N7)-methyltransferase
VKQEIQQGVEQLGLDAMCPEPTLEYLSCYLQLLQRWNKAYNLTAVRDPQQMVVRHILDSLAIANYLGDDERLIDVGTGAGLPGIPLALLYPEREFHLLDSNGKKTRFLFQVKTELGLNNVTVLHSRAQSHQDIPGYDCVISRAFASLNDMVDSCMHLCAERGRFLAMKGTYPGQELAALGKRCQLTAVHKLQVPGLGEERHLIELRPGQRIYGEHCG